MEINFDRNGFGMHGSFIVGCFIPNILKKDPHSKSSNRSEGPA
jgi:hypothetical protein